MKCDIFKGKKMVDRITTITISYLISIEEVNKNQVKSNKMTNHSVTWLFYGRIVNLKQKHLNVQTKLKALPNSDISC